MNIFKNIVVVAPHINIISSGVNAALLPLLDQLSKNNLPLTVACLDQGNTYSYKSFPTLFFLKKLGLSPLMKSWLFNMANMNSISLIHGNCIWMMPSIYIGMTARKYSIPLINSTHGCFSERAMSYGKLHKYIFWHCFQRAALNQSDCFHATSIEEYKDIRRLGFTQPVAIISNGVKIDYHLPPKPKNEVRVLLYLGRINQIKGLDMLLPAWSRVHDKFPKWTLKIVGPDNNGYLAKMCSLSSSLKLRNIEFIGEQTGIEKTMLMRNSDLFILPTYSENFAMTVVESMAVETPVIVTKGAPWGKLEDKQAGWWIDINTDAIEECLNCALSKTDEDLKKMGVNGRKWMESDFSWKEIAKKMEITYDWIISGKNPENAPEWILIK